MTQVFIEPELAELENVEQSAQWHEIAEAMGLGNQLATAAKSPQRKPPPYMPLDQKTGRIIRTLCPHYCHFKDYSHSTIPLEVLQEIQKCISHSWYKYIYVYYDDKTPDPFVIGYHEDSAWDRHYHLIARWGAEIIPFELMEAKAIARLETEARIALNEAKIRVEAALKNVKDFVTSVMDGKDIPKIDFAIRSV
jgi:hypothetical protein